MPICFVGIGSNIDPEANLKKCAQMLKADYPEAAFSSVYKTSPRDREDQDDFLNAVCEIETDETPEEIFEAVKEIEKELGKDPPYEKGPRTIDLDILLYLSPTAYRLPLDIPHPRMYERRFVLEPLFELTNDPAHREALQKTLDQSCEKTDITL